MNKNPAGNRRVLSTAAGILPLNRNHGSNGAFAETGSLKRGQAQRYTIILGSLWCVIDFPGVTGILLSVFRIVSALDTCCLMKRINEIWQPVDIRYDIKYDGVLGGPRAVHEFSLADLFAKYGDILWENGPHKYNVTSFIGELDELLSVRRFSAFGQDMVDELVGKLRENGNSNATINRKIAALRKLLRKALAMGDIHSLPEFRRQKERSGRIRFLDYEEEQRLFLLIRESSESFYLLSLFLVDTGARLSEAFRVRWPDLDDGNVTFWLTKSGRSRTVPLTARTRAAVEARRGAAKGPFAGLTGQQYRAVWNEARAQMGLSDDRDFVPHILRHTCASRLVKGGIDIRRVQMWLGHQTLQMTMRYSHLATADLTNCVAVLERRPVDGMQEMA